MRTQDYINALNNYCNMMNKVAADTDNIIKVTSVENIEGEQAELVRFTFGECEESCIAIFFDDGLFFTPRDWQTPVWDNEDWTIEDTDWYDYRGKPAIEFNGMPRIFA